MLLYLVRRDQAIGLPQPSARTLNLAAYRAKQQQVAMDDLSRAAFYRAIIQECQARVKDLVKKARTPKRRRMILGEVEQLNRLAEEAVERLEAMTDGS